MLASSIPTRFPEAFGVNAGGSYIRAVPTTSQIGIENGAASLNDGFPPLCFQPIGSGGVPPFGEDMNGILNQITLWNQWQAAGGPVQYDSTFSTAIGGYPKGAVLAATGILGLFWISQVDDNTSNPDTGGANWAVYNRAKLAAATSFYVATTGSDSANTGLTIGSPWLTIQHAINVINTQYDLAGQVVTINVATGTYNGGFVVSGQFVGQINASSLIILGNAGTPANVIINNGSGRSMLAQGGAKFFINGVKITSSSTAMETQDPGSEILYSNIDFGTCGFAHVFANGGGTEISAQSNYTISGSSGSHLFAQLGGFINTNGVTITISGTPAFTSFAQALRCSPLYSGGMTFSGSATGARYSVSLNGVIETGTAGGNPNYFPGNSAGASATGGQYY